MDFVTAQLPLLSDSSAYKLDIIHLRGQHFEYETHYPESQNYFKVKDYHYRQLNDEERQVVAHYDNATRWNDAVVDSILRYYNESEAVVVYLSDHGEEVYDDLPVKGRIYAEPSARQVRQEFEIPFWIWCSPKYVTQHPDILEQIHAAANSPWITDRLPHLLLYLAGISYVDYNEKLSLISPSNNPSIPRMIEGIVNYDSLMKKGIYYSR
jgi:heptose-I-phosphate ethanolaminephosphotransferase